MNYEALLPYCQTDRQTEIIEKLLKCRSHNDLAKKMSIDRRAIDKTVKRIKQNAAKHGWAPDHDMRHTTADGYIVKGTSTLYGDDGNLKIQWVKTDIDKQRQMELVQDFISGLVEDIEPAKPKPYPDNYLNSDLMPSIFIGDAHIGMYAWGKETKHSDFDSDIATQQIRDAVDYLVEVAQPTESALLNVMGDFLHANGQNDQTYGGTPLDVDTRMDSVTYKAAKCLRYAIDKMLEKFGNVTVIVVKGNHDTDSSRAVRLAVDFYYEREPRVNILQTNGFYHYVEYGKWLLQISHGDKQKPESLVGSMARDMPAAWGRATHRMACVGHFHKEHVKVLLGAKYKVFAALPPADSWHASHGYMGDGEMEMITFRREGGIHSSHVYNIPQPRHEPDVTI